MTKRGLYKGLLLTFCCAGLFLSQVSCTTGPEIKAHLNWLDKQIKEFKRDGAQRCAPYVFANAESETAFTQIEYDQGQHIRAELHRKRASKWMQLTRKEMEPYRKKKLLWMCRGVAKPRRPPPPPRKVDPCAKDTDGDNIPDCRDICVDRAEDYQGFEDFDGCPDGTRDSDNDGYPDWRDKCPLEPEDRNGYLDGDGCPDAGLDTDGDGVPDATDKCRLVPARTPNGCPVIKVVKKYKLIVVTAKKIELKQKVFFATARARIRERSFALLREVAKALKDNPTLNVCIEGHTDSRGGRSYNVRLSQARSKSVWTFLQNEGVSSSRMRSRGYGPRHPIDTNRTRAGRAANRRVEFKIVKPSEPCPLDRR